jgi:hypothetical protein
MHTPVTFRTCSLPDISFSTARGSVVSAKRTRTCETRPSTPACSWFGSLPTRLPHTSCSATRWQSCMPRCRPAWNAQSGNRQTRRRSWRSGSRNRAHLHASGLPGFLEAMPLNVNRAPVLTFWATVVAECLGHPHDTALTSAVLLLGPRLARRPGASGEKRAGPIMTATRRESPRCT